MVWVFGCFNYAEGNDGFFFLAQGGGSEHAGLTLETIRVVL